MDEKYTGLKKQLSELCSLKPEQILLAEVHASNIKVTTLLYTHQLSFFFVWCFFSAVIWNIYLKLIYFSICIANKYCNKKKTGDNESETSFVAELPSGQPEGPAVCQWLPLCVWGSSTRFTNITEFSHPDWWAAPVTVTLHWSLKSFKILEYESVFKVWKVRGILTGSFVIKSILTVWFKTQKNSAESSHLSSLTCQRASLLLRVFVPVFNNGVRAVETTGCKDRPLDRQRSNLLWACNCLASRPGLWWAGQNNQTVAVLMTSGFKTLNIASCKMCKKDLQLFLIAEKISHGGRES